LIAENAVTQSLNVQPGEIILITGTPAEVELMAAHQVAISKAGGESLIVLSIPEADKRALVETPIEHLSRTPTAALFLYRIVDGAIVTSSIQDSDRMADVTEERMSATRRAVYPLSVAQSVNAIRTVSLGQTGGIPTKEYAESRGADFDVMHEMFWDAVQVSPAELARSAEVVAGYFKEGTQLRLTSEAGTDLSFSLADVAPRINAGRTADVLQATGPSSVWLPAGEAYSPVDTQSANGKIVIPSMTYLGEPVKNLHITFVEGAISELSADVGESKLRSFFKSSDEATSRLSIVDVGTNPSSKPIAGSDHLSWEMGGLVSLQIGNNSWAGGSNMADGGFIVHIASATLVADGNVLVTNGELQIESR